MTRTVSLGDASAIRRASNIATGVSIIAHTAVRSGAPAASRAASTALTVSAPSTLGTTTASGPASAAARRSSACQGVPGALTRMVTSR